MSADRGGAGVDYTRSDRHHLAAFASCRSNRARSVLTCFRATKHGPLTDQNQTEAEREALCHLFAGAIGSYKNPHSHRTVALTDPREAQQQVMLATHLLSIVDARRPS
jgi:hypothetical protein